MNNPTAKITINEKSYDCPIIQGTLGDKAIDITKLRTNSGYITLDEGFANTGACKSAITFIDGEQGKLWYRGIPIEVLAENSTFIETAYLIIYGDLPTRKQMSAFSQKVLRNASLHEGMMHSSKVMALTALKLLQDPSIVEAAWKEHRDNGVTYECLMPNDLQPKLDRK